MALAVNRDRIEQAGALIEKHTASGEITYAAVLIRQAGQDLLRRGYGKAKNPDTVFLLASITKPMTTTGFMVLVDRGQVSLSDPVRKFIPEFTGGDRDQVLVRHLLTHSSGLPDMLPENVELRKRHAPLKDFVAGTCRVPLLFKPGTQVKYQSMGILLLAEIAERITKMRFRDFLRKEVFLPLGMTQTALGLGQHKIAETAECQFATDAQYPWAKQKTDYDWNSPYWRDLGAPWGGAHSTVSDVTRLLDCFLKPDGRVLKPATAKAMVTVQAPLLNEPWGLGWMMKPGTFGKACSPQTFGHYGATGTVAWADPRTQTTCVLLTTKPASSSRTGALGPVSDLVAEAVT